jgi:iron(III) transport system substrate-binding protein
MIAALSILRSATMPIRPLFRFRRATLATLLAAALLPLARAQDKALNLYSARHYQTDEALYANFTKAIGIRINRLDGK